jgi:hypothetical protein
MCPACIATALLVAAGTTSAGGVGFSLFKRARKKPAIRPPCKRPLLVR